MRCKPVELFIILVTTFLSAITSLTLRSPERLTLLSHLEDDPIRGGTGSYDSWWDGIRWPWWADGVIGVGPGYTRYGALAISLHYSLFVLLFVRMDFKYLSHKYWYPPPPPSYTDWYYHIGCTILWLLICRHQTSFYALKNSDKYIRFV